MSNIRDLLDKYNKTKFEISNLEMRKNILLEDGYDTSVTPSYSGSVGGSGNNDKVYNAVEKLDNDLEKINNQINTRKSLINMIDNLINTLGLNAQFVVKQRAFHRKDFSTIAKEIRQGQEYNSTYCRELYSRSCKSMQDLLDGMEANNVK